ncbi:hypothetical protein KJ359_001157 [Pestalotiopsis sp. 9143b]|nr:hypothetical protein KJ359_001157 [Pestalotiopsis sp. 9143b]
MGSTPARESEAPELDRGGDQTKERVPAYLVQSYSVDGHRHQPDLETVHSSGNTTHGDLEVSQQGGYDPYTPSNGTYTPGQDAYQVSHDHAQQAHAGYSGGEYKSLPPGQQEKGDRKRICGLAVPTFIFFIILGIVVIGASVGGAVGGVTATNNAKQAAAASASGSAATGTASTSLTNQPMATATTSSLGSQTTDASALSVPTSGVVVSFNCDQRSGQNQTLTLPSGGQEFIYSVECGVDMTGGSNGGVDLFAATAYTFEDCLRVCSSYNANSGTDACKGVSFNTELSTARDHDNGNCWAKNTTDGNLLTNLGDNRVRAVLNL